MAAYRSFSNFKPTLNKDRSRPPGQIGPKPAPLFGPPMLFKAAGDDPWPPVSQGSLKVSFPPSPPPPELSGSDAESLATLSASVATKIAEGQLDVTETPESTATSTTEAERSHDIEKISAGADPNQALSTPASGAGAEVAEVASHASFAQPAMPEDPGARTSAKVYLAGFNVQARYILHALAGQQRRLPPVQVLTPSYRPAAAWREEHREIVLYDHLGNFVSSRRIACPQTVSPHRLQTQSWSERAKPQKIRNLVVVLRDHVLIRFMNNLKDSIDSNTTLCLFVDGLGVMETLNERVFTDPETRPQYIVGLYHQRVLKHPGKELALRHNFGGKSSALLLSTPAGPHFRHGIAESSAMSAQTKRLLEILSLTPELNAKKLPWNVFLARKLPSVIWSSIADAISVMLGCRYSHIVERMHARELWAAMFAETVQIVAAMPEIEPAVVKSLLGDKFRSELWGKLVRQRDTESHWLSLIRAGRRPPVDHFNGYFVRRAREMGLECKHNSTAVSIIQGKYDLRAEELYNDIPFGAGRSMYSSGLGSQPSANDESYELDM